MKLPTNVNPAHVASKDETRYVLNGVKVADGIAVATDGRSLMAAAVEMDVEDADRPAIIPTRAMLKAFPKSRGKRKRQMLIHTLRIDPIPEADTVAKFGTVTVTDKDFDRTTVKEIDGNFPTWHHVLVDPAPFTLKLAFNAALLANIAKAFGDTSVTMHLDPSKFGECGYSDPIYITSKDQPDAFAILMPMRHGEVSGSLSKHALLTKAMAQKAEIFAAEAARFDEQESKIEAEAAAESTQPQTTTEPQTTAPTE